MGHARRGTPKKFRSQAMIGGCGGIRRPWILEPVEREHTREYSLPGFKFQHSLPGMERFLDSPGHHGSYLSRVSPSPLPGYPRSATTTSCRPFLQENFSFTCLVNWAWPVCLYTHLRYPEVRGFHGSEGEIIHYFFTIRGKVDLNCGAIIIKTCLCGTPQGIFKFFKGFLGLLSSQVKYSVPNLN